ncbi:MAG: hypothetical protein IJX50_00045 [Clostridia bacterium]|nr:hypothetical protein [Clostridia bacterium]
MPPLACKNTGKSGHLIESHSKKVDGTGLGLSIVKHIAKQNNIEIYVDSKLGEGSKFTAVFKEKIH